MSKTQETAERGRTEAQLKADAAAREKAAKAKAEAAEKAKAEAEAAEKAKAEAEAAEKAKAEAEAAEKAKAEAEAAEKAKAAEKESEVMKQAREVMKRKGLDEVFVVGKYIFTAKLNAENYAKQSKQKVETVN